MDLRDWLIVVGVVALVAIIADGIRRVKKRGKLRLDIDKQYEDMPDVDLSHELPNGGARVASGPPPSAAPSDSDANPLSAKSNHDDAADDVDLLLQGDFKGVGQGAHQWLESSDQPEQEPISNSQPSAGGLGESEEYQAEVKDVRQEPSFSDIDLLDCDAEENKPETAKAPIENIETLSSECSDNLGEGIISPVRVRKLEQEPVRESALSNFETESIDELSESLAREQDFQQENVEPVVENTIETTVETTVESLAEQSAQKVERSTVELVEKEENLDLNQPVSVLIDQLQGRAQPVATAEPVVVEQEPELESQSTVEPTFNENLVASDEVVDTEPAAALTTTDKEADAVDQALAGLGGVQAEEAEDHLQGKVEKPEPKKPAKKKSRIRRLKEEIQTSFFDLDPELAPEPEPEETPASAKPKKRKSKRLAKKNASKSEPVKPIEPVAEEPEESPVLVISVAAKDPFNGKMLFKLVEACGMEYGDMSIYHRHEEGPLKGAVQFSMANAVKPGTFSMEERDSFSTPAVTFFLEMSQPKDLMNAFDCMLATAQAVADNLNGMMKDENRSVMRPQTIEHYRQQIRDYERRRLAKRA